MFLESRYAVGGSKDEWAAAEAQVAAKINGGKAGAASVVSVKNPNSTKGSKRKAGGEEEAKAKEQGKKDKKDKKRRKN
jgi:N-acetyltransferase 10